MRNSQKNINIFTCYLILYFFLTPVINDDDSMLMFTSKLSFSEAGKKAYLDRNPYFQASEQFNEKSMRALQTLKEFQALNPHCMLWLSPSMSHIQGIVLDDK